jgi:hypothetical protein
MPQSDNGSWNLNLYEWRHSGKIKAKLTLVLGPYDEEEVTEEVATMASPYNGLLPSSHILALNTTTYGLVVSPIPNYNFESETEPITMVEGEIVDCKVSRWSRWSKCSVSCGLGYKTRSRSIEVSYFKIYNFNGLY